MASINSRMGYMQVEPARSYTLVHLILSHLEYLYSNTPFHPTRYSTLEWQIRSLTFDSVANGTASLNDSFSGSILATTWHMSFDNQLTFGTVICSGQVSRETRYSSSSCDHDSAQDVHVSRGGPWISASSYLDGESGAVRFELGFDCGCFDFYDEP